MHIDEDSILAAALASGIMKPAEGGWEWSPSGDTLRAFAVKIHEAAMAPLLDGFRQLLCAGGVEMGDGDMARNMAVEMLRRFAPDDPLLR